MNAGFFCCCCLLLNSPLHVHTFAPPWLWAVWGSVGARGHTNMQRGSYICPQVSCLLSCSGLCWPAGSGHDAWARTEGVDPNAFKLNGRLWLLGNEKAEVRALLKRLRQQHSKRRESLVLHVGCGTAPKQHGVATMGVCSFYLPWEKVVECFFCCTAYYH